MRLNNSIANEKTRSKAKKYQFTHQLKHKTVSINYVEVLKTHKIKQKKRKLSKHIEFTPSRIPGLIGPLSAIASEQKIEERESSYDPNKARSWIEKKTKKNGCRLQMGKGNFGFTG